MTEINWTRCMVEMPPLKKIVLVDGGTAMRVSENEWVSGMEDPYFERTIDWEVTHWADVPRVTV